MKIRIINKFPSYYVSDTGIVFTVLGSELQSLIPRVSNMGYERVLLRQHGKNHELLVHRLVAETFLPPMPRRKLVNHKDCNKLNNNLDNLEWVTPKGNARHYYATKKVLYKA